MLRPLAALTLSALIAAPLALPAQEVNEGRRLAETMFESLDGSNRGFVDMGEYSTFGADIFFSMDTDQDTRISLDEFMSWDFGMRMVAEERDRVAAYETALRVVFAFWDRNGDGLISRTEHRQSLAQDFQRADIDNDAVLSRDEFLSGFSVNVALRAALDTTL